MSRRPMNRRPIPRSILIPLALALALAGCGGGEPADARRDTGGHAEDGHADGDAHGEGDAGHAEDAGHGEEGDHGEDPPSTTIPAKTAASSGIVVAAAGPGTIADEHQVQGLLTPIESRVAQVMARFPGPIRALRADVGDAVRAGQPLAVVESNLSLTDYTIRAPISGVVLARGASLGGVAGEGATLYEIADLSELWVDLHIFGSDAQHIAAGSPVLVARMSDGATAATVLERILPSTATASQSTVARARIRNRDGLWRPGSSVQARITVARQPVGLMVPQGAVQSMGGRDVVFVQRGETYARRAVALGRRDAGHVQVLSGLEAGERVVVEQSFLVKADIEKSSAGHDH